MKKLTALLCAIALTVTAAGCGTSNPPASSSAATPVSSSSAAAGSSEAVKVELVAEPGAELVMMGGAHLVSVTESVLKDFMQQHPEIKITFEKYSRAEYPTKMKLQLSNGDATPDILLVHDDVAPPFIKAGYLMDIRDIVDTANTLPVLGTVTKGESIYGLPNQVSSQYVFLYRKDIYEAEGLTVPKTFDEYFEQALKLKEKGYFSGAMDPVKADADLFKLYMGMLGGRLLDENGDVVLEKAVEALNLYKKCFDAGIWHKSGLGSSEEYWTAFNEGKIASFSAPAFHAAYYETNVNPEGNGGYGKLAVAPIMRFAADGPQTVMNNTEYFTINAKTKYPNAARMVVSYLTQSEESALKFANVNEEGLMARYCTGYIPGIQKVADGNGTTGWKAFGDEKVLSQLAQNLIDAKPSVPYISEKSAEINQAISEVISEMLLNNTYTPEQAIEEMRSRIEFI